MKKLILVFLVIFCGCNTSENQIENIEIMSYYYKPSENYKTQILDYLHYSSIDEKGNAETIKKADNIGKKYVKYRSVLNENLLKEISIKNLKLKDQFYKYKRVENFIGIYCGPNTRVKIKFKDNHILTFSYVNRKDNSKYLLFMKLYNILENNFAEGNFSNINESEIEKLKNKQNEFESYTINKDTLDLPFPPMPKNNSIKFIKN